MVQEQEQEALVLEQERAEEQEQEQEQEAAWQEEMACVQLADQAHVLPVSGPSTTPLAALTRVSTAS